jgi:antitoxin component YwqK of YwqJK toxin-antitoxin module
VRHPQQATRRFVDPATAALLLFTGPFWLSACTPADGPVWSDEPESPVAATSNAKIETREEFDADGNLFRRSEGITDAEGNFILHGTVTLFYPNGQKKTELNYINGLTHGPRASWYQSGQPWILGQYVDGREHGTWTVWYENGRKSRESHYEHGAWHGTFVEWHRNGQKRHEVSYVRGVKQGTETYWDEEGVVVRQTEYVDGVPQP